MTSAASTIAPSSAAGKLKLLVVTLVLVAVAELIGPTQFSVGPGKVVLLPMLWALLMAAAWGIAHRRVPGVVRVATAQQSLAGALLNAGLLLFVVKLGLTVGAALPQVKQAGWALLFQEFGHRRRPGKNTHHGQVPEPDDDQFDQRCGDRGHPGQPCRKVVARAGKPDRDQRRGYGDDAHMRGHVGGEGIAAEARQHPGGDQHHETGKEARPLHLWHPATNSKGSAT